MKRTGLVSAIILVLGLTQGYCPSGAKDLYKWVDEKGGVHYSDDASGIPEQYRDQAEKRPMKEDQEGPGKKNVGGKKEIKPLASKPPAKEKSQVNVNQLEGDVAESLKTVISLWKEGKYSALYDLGDRKSRLKVNREDFEGQMKKKGVGPAPSWEAVRDIRVEIKSATSAYATARIGLRPVKGGETRFRTETYPMSFENGDWKIDLLKILQSKTKK
jgi:hypothetical protein